MYFQTNPSRDITTKEIKEKTRKKNIHIYIIYKISSGNFNQMIPSLAEEALQMLASELSLRNMSTLLSSQLGASGFAGGAPSVPPSNPVDVCSPTSI